MNKNQSSLSLPPGLYRLAQDTINPRGDGRCNYNNRPWRVPVWREGWKFVVEFYDCGLAPTGMLTLRPLHFRDPLLFITKNNDVLGALVPHLVTSEPDLSSLLKMHLATGESVLTRLLKVGKITLNDVRYVLSLDAR